MSGIESGKLFVRRGHLYPSRCFLVFCWRCRKFPRGLTGRGRHAILMGRGSPHRWADPHAALRMAAEAHCQSEKRTISGDRIDRLQSNSSDCRSSFCSQMFPSGNSAAVDFTVGNASLGLFRHMHLFRKMLNIATNRMFFHHFSQTNIWHFPM